MIPVVAGALGTEGGWSSGPPLEVDGKPVGLLVGFKSEHVLVGAAASRLSERHHPAAQLLRARRRE